MTPLQNAYLAKLHATAQANLEFFKLNMPAIYARVTAASPVPSLDVSDQGDLSLRYPDGTLRSVTALRKEIEAQFAVFDDFDTRPQLLAFMNLRQVVDNPSHGDMQRYHYSNIDAEYPNRARRHFLEHYPTEEGLSRFPQYGAAKKIPLLIVLGSGIGSHLDRLVLDYEIEHLVVMDCDEDAFRVSLFFQDYVQLSRLAMDKGTDLSIIVGPDIEHLARIFMGMLRRRLPPFFVHGAFLFYAMSDAQRREELKKTLVQTLWQLYFGLGYFDDELISIRHTLLNLMRRPRVYVRPKSIGQVGAVAFVIGSGPSLDALLPLLQRYRERAVLLSCGTALGPLAHAGILPDFHFEKERPGIVEDVLTRTVPEAFRRQLSLIGLNVVKPEVFAMFGNGLMVMKESDTMANLLVEMGIVPRVPIDSQPTVTNMATSFALGAGFARIYLFGVDMGYRDPDKHHAHNTAYIGKLPEDEDGLRRMLGRRPDDTLTRPGNFGGEVKTNGILDVARLYLEASLRACPPVKVYNLNDGARLEGAEPLPPEDFPDLADAPDKSVVLAELAQAFAPIEVDVQAVAAALLAGIDAFLARIHPLLAREFTTREEAIAAMKEVNALLMQPEWRGKTGEVLYRGTILTLLGYTHNAITLILDDAEAAAKATYDFANLLDALMAGRAAVAQTLAEIAGLPAPAAGWGVASALSDTAGPRSDPLARVRLEHRLQAMRDALAAGEVDQVRQTLSCLIQTHAESAELWHLYGLAEALAGDLEVAQAHLRRALDMRPAVAAWWNDLGEVLRRLGCAQEAEEAFRLAIAHEPSAAAYNNLGVLLTGLCRHDEALAALGQAIALDPTHALAHNNLGVVFERCGRLEDALICYEQAVTLDPGLQEALANHADLLKAHPDLVAGVLARLGDQTAAACVHGPSA
ncbi:MAG: 6-hydroxymethylpterin diphosphokinase MptE-like protein [Thiobacillaceae bacterium]